MVFLWGVGDGVFILTDTLLLAFITRPLFQKIIKERSISEM